LKLEGRFEEVLSDDTLIVLEYLFEERERSRYVHTEGLRYKLVLVVKWATEDSAVRVLLYDNYHESEPHVHVYGRKEKIRYEFSGIGNLLSDFSSEVQILTGLNIEDWIKEIEKEVLQSPLKRFW